MKSALKINIKGSVYGVFYNQFVKDNADKFNLRGYLRNMEDNNIEIIVEGDEEDINNFFNIIKKGPKYSQVGNVETQIKKWSGDFKEFKILKF
jgi:acylphosphatase